MTPATPAASAAAPAPKRQTLLQAGVGHMKHHDVLAVTNDSLKTLAKIVDTDTTKAFDVVYVNAPWKNVSYDYLASLPVPQLFNKADVNGLLLWVDSQFADKAVDLIRGWGFQFKSVLHTVSYERERGAAAKEPSGEADAPGAGAAAAADDASEAQPMETDGEAAAGASVSSALPAKPAPRKQQVPPGWPTEGIVYSRSRQLWYAESAGAAAAANAEAAGATRFLKDPSFIRKRLTQVSTFTYPEDGDATVSVLSAKKKNFEHWRIFPEYDAYVPKALRASLDQIFKPNARVLSLFADGLHKNWYTWGPNVPGYFTGPLRNDSGFPLPAALLKYLGAMKAVTSLKFLNLINLYAVQYAKQLGFAEAGGAATAEAPTEEAGGVFLTPLVENRLHEFIGELCTRAENAGGIRENALAAASGVQLESADAFEGLDPTRKTQFLLMVGHVIRSILRKNADAAEKRRRTTKRKRNTDEDGGADSNKENREPARKYGIAAPVRISDDLAAFMGLDKDEKVARTTVVKFINDYIGQNKLQNPDKRSTIMVENDKKLKQLLQPDPNFGPVTYFNLCKLLGPHFISEKKAKAAAAAAAAATAV